MSKVLDVSVEPASPKKPKTTVLCSDRGCCPTAVDLDVTPSDEPAKDPKKKSAAQPAAPAPSYEFETTIVEGGENPTTKTFRQHKV